jgi:hypothetical protein
MVERATIPKAGYLWQRCRAGTHIPTGIERA